MENYSPDRIRDEFVTPLIGLIGEFTADIQTLDNLIKQGSAPRPYLPLNDATAKKSVGYLKKLRRELHDKIAGIQDGTFKYRELELEKKREKYKQEKKSHKK